MSNFDPSVYVDTDALLNWKSRISTINNDSITAIKNIDTLMGKLDSCMAGNIAEGIKYDIGRLTKKCNTMHESMKDLEKILVDIVNKKQEQ